MVRFVNWVGGCVMEEAHGSSNSLPPFLTKIYEMVDDPSSNTVVSWSSTNKSFIVWNPPEFARDLLPKFFKHNNFSSFIRQLNTYGFRKVDPEQWEFANEDFVRGQPHLLKNIHRRKPVHSHSLQNVQGAVSPLTESERQSLKDQIEKLKHDKEQLLLELQRHEQEWKMYEIQLHCSKDRLETLEKKHQTMLSSVSQVLQKPGIALNHWQLTENMERKRRLPRSGQISDEASIEDPMEASQVLSKENAESTSAFTLSTERLDSLESSMTFWENIVHDVGGVSSFHSHSNLDFDASISCANSPAISCMQLDVEVQPKSPSIDMNSEPVVAAVHDLVASEEQPAVAAPVATGVNDVFWEQFLTENPGAQEAQSERKESNGRNNEGKPGDFGRFWWNIRNVNNLPEQMGQS